MKPMSYRGDDLDLRTPERWGGKDLTRDLVRVAGEPFYVDDTVLACCNHAFDLALAHRAAEVRIEHLLNAITRTDAAASVLERRGINVASLRRETATSIAADSAFVNSSTTMRVNPRRSAEFEDVLRLAAERAYPRRVAIGTEDILVAMFDMNRDIAGIAMLRRHASGWTARDLGTSEPLATVASYQTRTAPAQPYFASEPARELPRQSLPPVPQVPASVFGGTMTDAVQNNRIDQLERMIRDLSQEQSNERKTFAALIGELQRETFTQRDDTGRFHGSLSERLQSIEHMVSNARPEPMQLPIGLMDRLQSVDGLERKLEDIGRAFSAVLDRLNGMDRTMAARPAGGSATVNMQPVMDRLASLERSVTTRPMPMVDMEPLHDRMTGLERALAGRQTVDLTPLHDRLTALDRSLAARPASGTVDMAPLHDRLTAIERTIASRPASGTVDMAPLNDRLTAIERTIASRPIPTMDLSAVNERMAGIERAIARYPVPQPLDMGPLFERLNVIEQRTAEAGRLSSGLGERLGQFELTMQTSLQTSNGGVANGLADRLKSIEEMLLSHQVEVGQLTGSITEELQGLSRDVRGNAGMGDRIQSLVGDRLQSFASNFDRQGSDMVAAIASPLSQRMASLSTEVQARDEDMVRAVSLIGDKLAGVEKTLAVFGQRTIDTHTAHGRDLIEVHDALVKLNSNQQTLAASMDQWRLDTNNDLTFMSNRMEGLEKNVAKPVQMLESLSYNVQTLQRTTVKREEQRSRFRQWLMGTDDWYAASWEQNGSAARNNGANYVQTNGNGEPAVEDRPVR
jgi:Clp amino terminal domain, pathogenicity island component